MYVRFSLNLPLELSFLAKHTFPKFCDYFSESYFRAQLLRFTIGFMVLNKFNEINSLIKRNLNFKGEVKSHKVPLQPYFNIKYYLFCLKSKLIINIRLIADGKY